MIERKVSILYLSFELISSSSLFTLCLYVSRVERDDGIGPLFFMLGRVLMPRFS